MCGVRTVPRIGYNIASAIGRHGPADGRSEGPGGIQAGPRGPNQGSVGMAVHHSRRGGQLLGAADAQTAPPATFSTAPTRQLLGSANAETTPAGAPAAAADRTQRPDATCGGKNG